MVYVEKDDADEGDLETGTRVCKSCGTRQPMAQFHYANGGRNRRRKCKGCVDEGARQRRAEDPAGHARRARWRAIKQKYNLTEEQFYQILEDQVWTCAICWIDLLIDNTHVDHDHETNEVRGLLCTNCNLALGHFRDDRWIVRNAAAYLRYNLSHRKEATA